MTGWTEITDAIGVALAGERVRGRALLEEAWDGTCADDGARRTVIAHYLADVQDRVEDEVAWDERALAAFAGVGDDDLAPVGIASARAMAPSLHLNLGDGYLRQQRVEEAARHLALALESLDALPADGYGDLVRRGVRRLGERVEAAAAHDSSRDSAAP
ncbi:hypothetical protein [Oryzobacter telluris]|uniref:hypothetical protein n=1 Tax=Oryzobacter telluris TaxID=3149179 RepID=UPI00370D9A5A